jgi:hypothetical protein
MYFTPLVVLKHSIGSESGIERGSHVIGLHRDFRFHAMQGMEKMKNGYPFQSRGEHRIKMLTLL